MAETKANAEAAFDFFIQAYGVKYDKATERLVKDRERLLTFYEFPAEHWQHIRTYHPLESTSATVRQRTVKTKGWTWPAKVPDTYLIYTATVSNARGLFPPSVECLRRGL